MTPPPPTAARLLALPVETVQGIQVPVAVGFLARLRGLAGLRLEEAGAGLLIPGCRSVHTFGMRFALDVVFLDGSGEALAVRRRLPPRRLAWCGAAVAVLELPAARGGEFSLVGD